MYLLFRILLWLSLHLRLKREGLPFCTNDNVNGILIIVSRTKWNKPLHNHQLNYICYILFFNVIKNVSLSIYILIIYN